MIESVRPTSDAKRNAAKEATEDINVPTRGIQESNVIAGANSK